MAVHAHPDDESSKGAAMMAAYEEAGAEVMVVTCTGGERGDLLNPAYGDTVRLDRDITGVRRAEMEEAGAALGIEHRWLGFMDSGLPEGDPLPPLPAGCFATVPLEQAAAPLVRVIREFRPHVLIGYDEIGGYPHPDHIKAHEITVEAYRAAGDPERYPGTGEPWTPSKLYYDRAFNPDKYRALHEAYLAAGEESPFAERMQWYASLEEEQAREAERAQQAREAQQAERGTEEGASAEADDAPAEGRPQHSRVPRFRLTDHRVTTQIHVADYLERRDTALRAHRTQVDPTGHFFAAPNELLRRTWPWEDYVLIDSRVETTLPETDLFTGLR
ncbi:mycothiol conjugate amidase Mca [Citricoccus sp. SGAir0253]|uniref:mycothiol conjugate amidase Mca n=1 Tax=Citricoccus sp. SGAir0253 TaxID=2567881 RepID=UPI0010CD02BD|nr:mycothiol conjugate amidase Mca [Citricoccus sp. SGAir0253]QCU79476.1 mycothiol conjugate amidase Mca [Citricoccus sp. SGAir0253]